MAFESLYNTENYGGFLSDTPDHMVLDSGALFVDFVVGVDTYDTALAAGKLIGSTQGAVTFSAVPVMRQPQVNRVKSKAKGLNFIESWETSMTGNVVTLTADAMEQLLVASDVDVSDDFWDKFTTKYYVQNSDYIDSLTLVAKVTGSQKPIYIVIKNALNIAGIVSSFADGAEAVIPFTFEGNINLSTAETRSTVPFEIYRPKAEGSVSGTASTGAAAQGTLTIDVLPTAAETITVGSTVYTFVAAVDFNAAGEISLGAGLTTCQANIIAAINGTDSYNSANEYVSIADFATNDAILTSLVPGTAGNAIVTTETMAAVTNIFDAAVLGTTTAGAGDVVAGATLTITIGSETFTATSGADGTFTIQAVPYSTSAGYTVAGAGAGTTGSITGVIVNGGEDTDAGVVILS